MTIAAIYGAIYKVTSLTVWAPYAEMVILIVGLVAAVMMHTTLKGTADFSGLFEAAQGSVNI